MCEKWWKMPASRYEKRARLDEMAASFHADWWPLVRTDTTVESWSAASTATRACRARQHAIRGCHFNRRVYQLEPVQPQASPARKPFDGQFPQRPAFSAAEHEQDRQRDERQQLGVTEREIEALRVEDVLPARWAESVAVGVRAQHHRWARQHKCQLAQRVLRHPDDRDRSLQRLSKDLPSRTDGCRDSRVGSTIADKSQAKPSSRGSR